MFVIFSPHRAHKLWEQQLEQDAVHLVAKGASNEKEFLILTSSPFKHGELKQLVKCFTFYTEIQPALS